MQTITQCDETCELLTNELRQLLKLCATFYLRFVFIGGIRIPYLLELVTHWTSSYVVEVAGNSGPVLKSEEIYNRWALPLQHIYELKHDSAG